MRAEKLGTAEAMRRAGERRNDIVCGLRLMWLGMLFAECARTAVVVGLYEMLRIAKGMQCVILCDERNSLRCVDGFETLSMSRSLSARSGRDSAFQKFHIRGNLVLTQFSKVLASTE